MKLKTKIKISFAVIIIIPIAVLAILFAGILNVHIKSVENKYDIDHVGIDGLANQTKVYNKLTIKEYNKIIQDIQTRPSKLMDENYLESINKELKNKHSFIVAKVNNQLLYNGCLEEEKSLADNLPSYRGDYDYPSSYLGNSYIYGDYKYLIKQLTFDIDGQNVENLYIVTIMDRAIMRVKKIMFQICISVIAIIILTAVVLAIWIQRSVMRPLNKLTDATRRITEGDLDFVLERTGKDEFGVLCADFENMRKRLKDSAEERVQYDDENKELISNISHDLKTPITAIKGYVEGIMDGVANTPEKMDKYIKTIYHKANDMDRLIGELTLYSRIDTNNVPYNFEKVNVDKYFSDCIEEISVELESENIVLTYFNYVDKDVVFIADAEQLKRVINNIISNSVKYIGGKRGMVNIKINDEEDFIHVEIEDNGKGIGKKELPYIFDRFYRTDSSRNSEEGGSGIGLAIAKKIIEAHGGKIWATSLINTGTVMHFILRKYYEQEVTTDYEQNTDY